MLQSPIIDSRLDDVQAVLEKEAFLDSNIMDVQQYDDTLVLLTKREIPLSMVRLLLRKVWTGPIEVYCASALMTGSDLTLS